MSILFFLIFINFIEYRKNIKLVMFIRISNKKTLWIHNLIHNVLIIIHFVELLLLRVGFIRLFIGKCI